ncbi:hypothetical protein P152DRAFT_465116 [Eremomyces bilateralis CBS 781.70]|uniref:Uncharacterized protein n=1 Tax=Eremomyces bilateralis CBS 781.70 TaxID=1392243 RepID=A0A6G1G8C1_9PEZI|nr:uncharacterized protein P152DRAFT_465116 [Eremomyces bilateralis CBS 781.70]KAF1814171.1 hypothetical protein P152DRAFT_465116 [Eremomyces bilateralis CBS 781.70]
MTLPPYTPSVRDTEQVIAREGERGGMDTVVEFPETVDDEEQRREEEMESLYQIRRTRRQENTDREERRRLRREARERGDLAALEELRESTRAASEAVHTNPEHSAALIAAHQTVNRDRRVSSVQYGNIGVVQHDGSRLRSHSTESERPLLEGAAGMDGQERSVSRSTLTTHHRGRSASSVMSVSTNASDDGFHTAAASPALSLSQPSRNGNGESEFEMVAVGGRGSWPSPMARARSNTGTTAEGTGGDVADQRIPELDPPMYEEAFEAVPLEDAPPYESPVRVGAPQLPMLEQLPSITVTESHSPVTPPMGGDERRF